MWLIASAYAQDPTIVMPAVPVVGVSPVTSWLMAIASLVVTACLPIFLLFLKQKFNADQTTDQGNAIVGAAQRGAKLGSKLGLSETSAVDIGVAYVKAAQPGAIAATPQATDEHLANMVRAELPSVPSVNQVVGPVPDFLRRQPIDTPTTNSIPVTRAGS
jgi:hypothetical protein